MDMDTEESTVKKLVRVGRKESEDGAIKCRPRFSVNSIKHKREILKASSLSRKSSTDNTFNNVYFMQDLPKNQRKVAYELRVERRTRKEKKRKII